MAPPLKGRVSIFPSDVSREVASTGLEPKYLRNASLKPNRKDLSARVPNGVLPELKKLYYDIAGISDPIPFNAIRALVGTSQLLFGTDYPFWSPQVAVKILDDLGVAGAERQKIERGNALALLPRLAA